MNPPGKCRIALLATVLVFLFTGLAESQTVTWSGTAGDWTSGSNWLTGTAPGSGTNALIDSGTAQLSNSSTGTANALLIGESGTGVASLTSSAVIVDSSATLGDLAGSSGTMQMDTSSWMNSGTLTIGNYGTGVVTGGGDNVKAVTILLGNQAASSGSWNMDHGLASGTNLIVGASGTGSMITSGQVTFTNVILGQSLGSSGFVTSSGSLGAAALTIGGSGAALDTLTGGITTSNTMVIGSGASASGTLAINKGSVSIAGSGTSVVVGQSGAGSVVVGGTATGSLSTAGYMVFGQNAGSNGSLTINNLGQVNSQYFTYFGVSGTGNLVLNQGSLSASYTRFGDLPGGVGTGTLNGGVMSSLYYMTVGSGGEYQQATGQYSSDGGTGLLVIQGGVATQGTTVIGDYANSSGTISITSGSLVNSGSLVVGNRATGLLNIGGGVVTTGTGGGLSGFFSGGVVIGNSDPLIPSSSSGTINVSSGSFLNQLNIIVGSVSGTTAGTGALKISGGYVSDANAFIGTGTAYSGPAGSQDYASVSGGTWANSGTLAVGSTYSTGSLAISGGYVSSAAGVVDSGSGQSVASATVNSGTWALSGKLIVGDSGTGSLSIGSGGSVTLSSGTMFVGNAAGGMGSVTIASSLATGTIANLVIGNGGVGTMDVSNSVLNISNNFTVGASGTGTATLTNVSLSTGPVGIGAATSNASVNAGNVTFASGTWRINGSFAVGSNASGTFTLSGGRVTQIPNQPFGLGAAINSMGVMIVSGGTFTAASNLTAFVGSSGTGILTITDGGVFNSGSLSSGTLRAGLGSGPGYAVINIGTGGQAGTLNAAGILGGGSSATVNFNQSGTTTFAPNLQGTLKVNNLGTGLTILTGSNSYTGNTAINSGTLQFGNGGAVSESLTGQVTDNGALVFNSAGAINLLGDMTGSGVIVQAGSGITNYTGFSLIGESGSGGVTTLVKSGTLALVGGYIIHDNKDVVVGDAAGDNGVLTLESGSTPGAVNAFNITIGNGAGSQGAIVVSGGTFSASNNFIVGGDGAGAFTANSGTIEFGYYGNPASTSVGNDAGSSGTMTVTGGTVVTRSNFYVGNSGTGVFNMSGGSIDTGNNNSGQALNAAYIGNNAGSSGTATITGGTFINSGSFIVGRSGTGVVNLGGDGVITVAGGTGTVMLASGAGSAGSLNLAGGTLNAGVVTAGSGTGILNFMNSGSNTVATRLAGSLNVNQIGAGVTVLTGSNTYTGSTNVIQGALRVNGSNASSSGFGVSSGATLGGSGVVSAISGAGTVAPGGNAILTASRIDPGTGLDLDFRFSQLGAPNYASATASGNDVLHLTGATPLAIALGSGNVITLDFTGVDVEVGQTYYGGIFLDSAMDDSMLNGATFQFTGLNGVSMQYDGLAPVAEADFTSGTVTNGEVMKFEVTQPVPAAPAWALAITSAGLLIAARREIRKTRARRMD